MRTALRRTLCALGLVLSLASQTSGQEPHEHASAPAADVPVWEWTWDANVFVGWNYQYRKFRDFQVIESQNWFVGSGERPMRGGRLRLSAMLSLEPLTIRDLGSPQAFQTGETFQQVSLVDYQHPHDLFMGLGATYSRQVRGLDAFVQASLVGAPSIGPVPFMHRPSAAENPAAPLSHHQMDATHITPGVVRAGVDMRGIGIDASWFRGEEPDENRTDLDLGALDSRAVRLSWRRGPWHAQVSGAHLTTPEWVEPLFDVPRLTASLDTRAPAAGWPRCWRGGRTARCTELSTRICWRAPRGRRNVTSHTREPSW